MKQLGCLITGGRRHRTDGRHLVQPTICASVFTYKVYRYFSLKPSVCSSSLSTELYVHDLHYHKQPRKVQHETIHCRPWSFVALLLLLEIRHEILSLASEVVMCAPPPREHHGKGWGKPKALPLRLPAWAPPSRDHYEGWLHQGECR